jgi:DNA (cytosine-5)-methyltransferase 1
MDDLSGYYIKKVGQNKGAPRIWMEGEQTRRAGFAPGQKYDIVVQGRTIVLQANPDGSRVVSSKRAGEKVNPVIDLNSNDLLALFDGQACVRMVVKQGAIHLMPLASELKKQERFKRLRQKLELGEALTTGSLSHGVGVLSHAVHSGLQAAGIKTELAFANEIREDLLEQAAEHNDAWTDHTMTFAAPMQELAFDERGLAHVPRVEILEMGLPCSGASKAGRSKRNLAHPEAHPFVGHLVVAALVIVNKANAAVVLFENVPEYATSASADILRNQLRDMGYVTSERILNGNEWGALENRNRWCMVAVTEGIEFDFAQLQPPDRPRRTISDVLDPEIGPEDERWRTYDYLKKKEVRDADRGNSFAMQVVHPEEARVPTLRKGYQKGGSTDPLLAHPHNPDLLRQFTVQEHAKIKEVPAHLVEGLSATHGHEALGQGIVYRPFHDVGVHIGLALQDFRVSDYRAIKKADAIVALAKEAGLQLKSVDSENGRYSGQIIAFGKGVAIQDLGRGEGVAHQLTLLDGKPRLGELAKVQYSKGRAGFEAVGTQAKNKSVPQMRFGF